MMQEVPISYMRATTEYINGCFNRTVFTKCISELGLVQGSSFAVSSINSANLVIKVMMKITRKDLVELS